MALSSSPFPAKGLGFEGQAKMAPKVGLEPIVASFLMYSLLLIIAFLCANLPAKIRAFPSCCKLYFASLCNNRQKNLCGTVRLCGNCAVVKCCAVTVRGLLPGQHCKRAVAGHCERLAGLVAGLDAGRGSRMRAAWPMACRVKVSKARVTL